MEKLPIVRISGFDTRENVSFCYEVDISTDIRFSRGGWFVEFETETEVCQIPVEYVDSIAVLH